MVKSALRPSISVWKRTIRLANNSGVLVQAFHTPNFLTNLICVLKFSLILNINFTCVPPRKCSIGTCDTTFRNNKSMIKPIEINKWLYSDGHKSTNRQIFPLSNVYTVCHFFHLAGLDVHLPQNICAASEWHQKLSHNSSEKLLESNDFIATIPKFTKQAINSVFCTDCIIGNCKRNPCCQVINLRSVLCTLFT